MESIFTAKISAFMRGANKDPNGWHRNINNGDYAFILALREQYFPFSGSVELSKVQLVFENGNAAKNQDPALIYLKDVEFPPQIIVTPERYNNDIQKPRPLITHLTDCLTKLGLGVYICEKGELPVDSDAVELRAKVSIEKTTEGNLKLGNGELAKITNKVLEGHVDHMAAQIRSQYRGNNKPSSKYLRPRDLYRGFLDHLLEAAGIENSAAVAQEAVNKIGTGCGNWEKALTRATKHAKEIIPQTKMYKTTMFEIDGQKLEVREKIPERDWVEMVTNFSSMLGLRAQTEGR